MVRCLKFLAKVTFGISLLWAHVDGIVAGAARARQAEVHQVKITQHVTFSPLLLQMRSGDRIKFCDESGLYIKPFYFPFDGIHPPPNDLVRLGDVPPHQCMTTNPIVLPEGSRGRTVLIFSEIQNNLKLIVGLYPDDSASIPPLENNPYAEEPILGSWKGCDRIMRFSKEGDWIVGHYVEVADLSEYGFENNDVSHKRLVRTGENAYKGIVVWKFVETTPSGKEYTQEERMTLITVHGDSAHDSGGDPCGRNMIRISIQ